MSGTTQPFLHQHVTTLTAPVVVVSRADGQVRSGVEGIYDGDLRLLRCLEVRADGELPEALGHSVTGGRSEFTAVLRHLGDDMPDPTVLLVRSREVTGDGVTETLTLRSTAARPARTRLTVEAAADLADMTVVKAGGHVADRSASAVEGGLEWGDGSRRVTVTAQPPAREPDVRAGVLAWDLEVPARGETAVVLQVHGHGLGDGGGFRPVASTSAPPWSRPVLVADDRRLPALLDRGLDDLAALLVADPDDPRLRFVAAGSPWFLTLFGRDSLWAARMLLPLGTGLAEGTLAVLARRQGTRHDPGTEEQPGKILHEVREQALDLHGGRVIPALYFGTVDATPLWVSTLVEAWRWGMAPEAVEAFLPVCEAALAWLVEHGDSDGDGFLEYVDSAGTGLSNQGWKDSGDSIQWADGRLADAPLALCEVQAYAYEAAVGAADLLEAFGRPGDRWRDWAARLQDRFRRDFWVEDGDGAYPAVALDAAKGRVDSVTSNIGHLLGTGLLDEQESRLVAARLSGPDMDSGYGLRTLSSRSPRFGPLSYHGGAVWPHDTAIVARGLARSGAHRQAWSLLTGLLRAGTAFDHRLPELFAGTDRAAGEPVLAYPAACRPQAWAAASGVSALQTLLGLEADVPRGGVTLDPLDPTMTGAVRVDGLRVAGQHLSVAVVPGRGVQVDAPAGLDVHLAGERSTAAGAVTS